jgi:hypothetical protein
MLIRLDGFEREAEHANCIRVEISTGVVNTFNEESS